MLALFQVSLADSLKWTVLLGQRPLASAAKGSGIRPAKKGKNKIQERSDDKLKLYHNGVHF